MSNYTKTVNFATKDNLSPGNPLKIVKGTEIDTEYNNIATAIATKTDNSAAAITGGSITGITDLAVADGGTGASTAAGALNNLLPSQTSNANKYLQTDGTNATWDAVSLSTADITGTLPVANGGTGVTSSTGTGNVVLSNSPTLVTPALGTPSAAVLTNATGLPISTGVSGLGTGVATLLATPSSANLASAITDETGSGSLVFATSPTLVTPILGTPTSGTLTNATGLPISTGVSGLGTGVATFLGTPSSANLISAVTDETGTGSLVFATSPTLVTPALGTPSALVGTNITGTASGLTAGNVTTNANLTGAITSTGNATSLGSFSSANLLGALTDETGTGSAVFATSPTLVTPILGTPTSATLTNATGLPLTTGVTGTLPVANGGTGTSTPSIVAGTNVTVTGTWPNQTIASTASGTGDVVGPASSTDNAFARFDSTTGKLLQNSTGATLSDTGAAVFTGALDVLGNSTAGSNLKLYEDTDNGTNFVSLKAPNTIAADVTFTLPSADGTNAQVLQTNGSGVLSFATVSGGGSPGGSTTEVQYNNAGAFGGITGATTNGTALTLTGAILNGTIGATTPSTGAFTTLSATGVTTLQTGTAALPALTTSGDTNTGVFFPAADSVATTVGGAEGTRLTSTGLGVGTTTPDVLSRGYGTHLSVSNTSSSGAAIQINGGSVGYPALELGRSGVRKVLLTAQSTVTEFGNLEAVPLVIKTNDVERARFNTTGAFVFNGGTTTADGIGITFPATVSLSTDPNTLDDYEEGTFTVVDRSGAGLTFTTNASKYIKIGKMVYAFADVTFPTTASTAGLNVSLPFAPDPQYAQMGAPVRNSKSLTCNPFTVPDGGGGIIFLKSALYTDYQTNANMSGGIFQFSITYSAAN